MTTRGFLARFVFSIAAAAFAAGTPGCGSDLKQAHPVGDGGSQGDDGASGTAASGPVSDGMATSAATNGATGTSATTADTTQATSETASGSTTDTASGSTLDSGPSSSGEPTGCRSEADCAAPTPVCDVDSGDCVVCLPGGDACQPGSFCDPDLLDCVPGCDDDADCGAQVCDTTTHACVDCVDDGDCTSEATPVCDLATQTCVQCVDEGDCATGVCTAGACVTLGYDCLGNSNNCNAGEQCCSAPQCNGDCMISCGTIFDCPPGMGCEHGWCLFTCNFDDDDCAAWPGYTCQHSGLLCEADGP